MKYILILPLLFAWLIFDCRAQPGNLNASLSVKIIRQHKKLLRIEFSLENKSGGRIYFAAHPKKISGAFGYYLALDETDKSVLKIESRVYSTPPYYLYVDNRGVELKTLDSGQTYNETVTLNFPAKETDPPSYEGTSWNETIVLEKIKEVRFTIGYFAEEEGIIDFLQSKTFGWHIQGEETFSKGDYKDKSFLEIQTLVTSTTAL